MYVHVRTYIYITLTLYNILIHHLIQLFITLYFPLINVYILV